MILVAVAAENQNDGQGFTANQPDSVTYGGTAMTPGPTANGGSRWWSPDIFLYFLLESGLTGKSGTQRIVIDGTQAGGTPGSYVANVVQLNGVRQSNPLTPSSSGFVVDHGDPDTITQSVMVATTGSRVYSVVAGDWANPLNYVVTPMGTMATLFMSTDPVTGTGGTPLRASAVYLGGGSAGSLPVAATPGYTVAWTTGADALTHLLVVVNPASQ